MSMHCLICLYQVVMSHNFKREYNEWVVLRTNMSWLEFPSVRVDGRCQSKFRKLDLGNERWWRRYQQIQDTEQVSSAKLPTLRQVQRSKDPKGEVIWVYMRGEESIACTSIQMKIDDIFFLHFMLKLQILAPAIFGRAGVAMWHMTKNEKTYRASSYVSWNLWLSGAVKTGQVSKLPLVR
jgi:hypothetical protein